MLILILVSSWLVSIPLAYLVVRCVYIRMTGYWTCSARSMSIILCLVFGPIAMLIATLVLLIGPLKYAGWGICKAKW